MKRLPKYGASVASGELTRDDLRSALTRLKASDAFDDVALDNLYLGLGRITGAWFANEESKLTAPIKSALRKLGEDLADAARVLSGNESGFRTTTEIYATRLTLQALALDRILKTDPAELLASFRRDAVRVGQACQIAAADLSRKSDLKGRDKFHWFDDFTKLLLGIAKRARFKPTIGYDWVRDLHCGWLIEAAQVRRNGLR